MIGDEFTQSLYDRISLEKSIALSKNKPLLILIGESHYDLREYFIELMIVQLASQYFSIKKLMLEQSRSSISTIRKCENLYKQLGIHGSMQSLYYFLNKNKMMTMFSIDEGKKPDGHEWNTTPEGVRKRNKVMCSTAQIRASGNDAVAIVGFNHLYGLLNETELSEHFHVFAINVALKKDDINFQTAYANVCYHFAFSDQIFQLTSIVSGQTGQEIEREALDKFEKQRQLLPVQQIPSALENLSMKENTPPPICFTFSNEIPGLTGNIIKEVNDSDSVLVAKNSKTQLSHP
ncbi:MAG: hypothetical protein HYX61_01090 [Gammaproteobacteria bacterium]|jgi:hypothetical protein|nr:hypothetical protein [Gammaproteobacteria bacterium]